MDRAILFQELIDGVRVDSSGIDYVGNLIVLRKGTSRRTICLDAHLDTVFPEGTDVKVGIKGDTLMAPGIGDDTRGLAILLAVFKFMNDTDINTVHDVLFIASIRRGGLGRSRRSKAYILFWPTSGQLDIY